MARLDRFSCALIACVAASLGCGGQTSSSADAAVDARADVARTATKDAGSDGACVTPGPDDGTCTYCKNQWYCFGSAPYDVCPNQGEGSCTEGAKPCFVCSEHVEGYVCYCELPDGGEPDAGFSWGCQSNEEGCGS
jgi:hypothetical protein